MDPPQDDEELPDGTVLEPEELDITDAEEVAELDESRFVIGAEGKPDVAEGKPNAVERDTGEQSERPGARPDREPGASGGRDSPSQRTESGVDRRDSPRELRGSDVKRWITQNLRQTDSQYAYRLAAKTGNEISHQQLASDDIGMAFDGLLLWYAQQVGEGTAVEDTLGILLAESNIRVRFPLVGLQAFLEETDLEPEDSIADLLEVVRNRNGLVFPRGRQR